MKALFFNSLCGLFFACSLHSSYTLPDHFTTRDKTNTIAARGQNLVFYIVVPEDSVKKETVFQELRSFTKDIMIPEPLLPGAQTKQPITLFFDWQEKENGQIRKSAGALLAKGINTLMSRFKTARFVVLGHEQGGNIVNIATHSLKKPLNIVVQLGVPFFPDETLHKDYLPVSKNIQELFVFYSDQQFAVMHPSLHPTYQKYLVTSDITTYIQKLLINNKQPTTDQMLTAKVGKEIFNICQLSKELYKEHHHLVVHLSTTKPETDKIIVLADTGTKTHSMQAFKETVQSKRLLKKLNKNLGRPLSTTLKNQEMARTSLNTITRKTKKS